VRSVKKGGVIGVTATDTAALCGAAPSACLRKYGAMPLHGNIMHEVGIRILLKKVIEAGAQYDIALTPVFCHSTEHYMRVYLKADRGAGKTNSVLKQVGCYENAGPLWLGRLWDEKLVDAIYKLSANNKTITSGTKKLLHLIKEEAKVDAFGYFDIATMSLKQVPKLADVISNLKAKGFSASRTHFSPTGIRTNAKKIL
ncbi:MAG: tRNA (guanine(10)-N(2))-dimethyltransferase, partial [Nanoarchaeota archaeon]